MTYNTIHVNVYIHKNNYTGLIIFIRHNQKN